MIEEEYWKKSGHCFTLPPKEADKIFFPGRGGKPTKARSFCNLCSVHDRCLIDAIEGDYEGFYAGTTKEERRVMARFHNGAMQPIADWLPSEPVKKRKVYRKIITTYEDTLDYLDKLVPPEDELGVAN